MNRREFLLAVGIAGGNLTGFAGRAAAQPNTAPVRWTRQAGETLFSGVSCEGRPLTRTRMLLDASCRLAAESSDRAVRLHAEQASAKHGPLELELSHVLRESGDGEDLLEATLVLRNRSDRPEQAVIAFATSAQPAEAGPQRVYVPLSAAGPSGDSRFAALGVHKFLKDCDVSVDAGDLTAHYLEPMASNPTQRETQALLLAPIVDVFAPGQAWRVAIFTPSDQPMQFSTQARQGWRAERCVTVPGGGTLTQRCWLLVHRGDASTAWQAFHRFAHREEFVVPDWAHRFRIHYYDFLSSARGSQGRRGDGYEADLPHFREFCVGMATQHGYYTAIGDYLHPDRLTWQAMRGDRQGAAEMSLDRMRARVQATRAAGARTAIYLHAALLDDAAPCFATLRDCIQIDARGQRMNFGWTGPDTAGKTWRASLAAASWRDHLLQQAAWIMEILQPDAIVVDETFAGLGYDHHADRTGPTSAGAIEFYCKLRALVRSYGPDKAFFTSDCSMSPFVLWADGECGDHAYPGLLGHPLYTQEPVRYLAALGTKPWRPCAWHFQKMWALQMKLARQVGAGVGVANGWGEYTGLAGLPDEVKTKILRDIEALTTGRKA